MHLNDRFQEREDQLNVKAKTTKRTSKLFKNHKEAITTIDDYIFELNGSFIKVIKKNGSKEDEKLESENLNELDKDINQVNKEEDDDDKDFERFSNDTNEENGHLVVIQDACKMKQCPFDCFFCKRCLCDVYCTCYDYLMNFNFCVHSHLALIFLRNLKENSQQSTAAGNFDYDSLISTGKCVI